MCCGPDHKIGFIEYWTCSIDHSTYFMANRTCFMINAHVPRICSVGDRRCPMGLRTCSKKHRRTCPISADTLIFHGIWSGRLRCRHWITDQTMVLLNKWFYCIVKNEIATRTLPTCLLKMMLLTRCFSAAGWRAELKMRIRHKVVSDCSRTDLRGEKT